MIFGAPALPSSQHPFLRFRADPRPVGLVLLGTGESGKSTIYKQFLYLTNRMARGQEQCYQDIIWSNTVQAFQRLVNGLNELDLTLGDPEMELEKEKALGLSQYYPIEVERLVKMKGLMTRFWRHRAIRECFCRSSSLQLLTSTK